MGSIGKILQNLRLEKGLSLEEVQKQTKIHLNILKAIEEDNYINLSPIYIKGFLKIYCKFLSIDPQQYIPDYIAPQNTTVKLGVAKKPLTFFKSASNRLGFLKGISRKTKVTILIILVFAISSVGLFSFGKAISSRRHTIVNEEGTVLPGPDKRKKKKVQLAQLQKLPFVSSKSKAKQSEPISGRAVTSSLRLSILAKEDCFISLKLDGRLVFYSNLKKGKSETWQAKEKIEFSLNNTRAVDLILNGEKISTSAGKKGQASKFLVTRQGLITLR